MRALITGGAGFIGSHLCERLIEQGNEVVAIDNFDSFYSPETKWRNLARLGGNPRFCLVQADIRDPVGMDGGLRAAGIEDIDVVIHLAARAGVRPSMQEPLLYSQVNCDGTVAVLELARTRRVPRFIFGSSSSVYGDNHKVPFSETDPVDRPISFYAATKRAGELMCHAYHHIYGMSVVCLRFFTVYGPRQRPDLAIHKFTRLLEAGEAIPMFGDGSTERDYTYIDDIVQGIEGAIDYSARRGTVFEIVNLGGARTTSLRRLVELLAAELGVEPQIDRLPAQPGDVNRTFADVSRANQLFGYEPRTRPQDGIPSFVAWFREHGKGASRNRRIVSSAVEECPSLRVPETSPPSPVLTEE